MGAKSCPNTNPTLPGRQGTENRTCPKDPEQKLPPRFVLYICSPFTSIFLSGILQVKMSKRGANSLAVDTNDQDSKSHQLSPRDMRARNRSESHDTSRNPSRNPSRAVSPLVPQSPNITLTNDTTIAAGKKPRTEPPQGFDPDRMDADEVQTPAGFLNTVGEIPAPTVKFESPSVSFTGVPPPAAAGGQPALLQEEELARLRRQVTDLTQKVDARPEPSAIVPATRDDTSRLVIEPEERRLYDTPGAVEPDLGRAFDDASGDAVDTWPGVPKDAVQMRPGGKREIRRRLDRSGDELNFLAGGIIHWASMECKLLAYVDCGLCGKQKAQGWGFVGDVCPQSTTRVPWYVTGSELQKDVKNHFLSAQVPLIPSSTEFKAKWRALSEWTDEQAPGGNIFLSVTWKVKRFAAVVIHTKNEKHDITGSISQIERLLGSYGNLRLAEAITNYEQKLGAAGVQFPLAPLLKPDGDRFNDHRVPKSQNEALGSGIPFYVAPGYGQVEEVENSKPLPRAAESRYRVPAGVIKSIEERYCEPPQQASVQRATPIPVVSQQGRPQASRGSAAQTRSRALQASRGSKPSTGSVRAGSQTPGRLLQSIRDLTPALTDRSASSRFHTATPPAEGIYSLPIQEGRRKNGPQLLEEIASQPKGVADIVALLAQTEEGREGLADYYAMALQQS